MSRPRGRVSVYGVGINDAETNVYSSSHTASPVYTKWRSMLLRCYSEKWHTRFLTYIGCSVHPDWHRFSAFKVWFDRYYVPGYHLDKDILIPGNKVYGPWTCCFVPGRVNTLLVDCRATRGNLPVGVTRDGKNYMAQCRDNNGGKARKNYQTVEDAAAWYRARKADVIRSVAADALEQREISPRIYAGLLRHADNLIK